jgi:hypothetical protein
MIPDEDGYDDGLAEAALAALALAEEMRIAAAKATEVAASAAVRAEKGLLSYGEFERAARSYLGCAAHRRHLPEHSQRIDRFSDAQVKKLWRRIDWHGEGALDAPTIAARLAVLQEQKQEPRGGHRSGHCVRGMEGRGRRRGWGEAKRREQGLPRYPLKVANAGAVGAPGRYCRGSEASDTVQGEDDDDAGDGVVPRAAPVRHRSQFAHNPTHSRGQRGYAANYASEEVSVANGLLHTCEGGYMRYLFTPNGISLQSVLTYVCTTYFSARPSDFVPCVVLSQHDVLRQRAMRIRTKGVEDHSGGAERASGDLGLLQPAAVGGASTKTQTDLAADGCQPASGF